MTLRSEIGAFPERNKKLSVSRSRSFPHVITLRCHFGTFWKGPTER